MYVSELFDVLLARNMHAFKSRCSNDIDLQLTSMQQQSRHRPPVKLHSQTPIRRHSTWVPSSVWRQLASLLFPSLACLPLKRWGNTLRSAERRSWINERASGVARWLQIPVAAAPPARGLPPTRLLSMTGDNRYWQKPLSSFMRSHMIKIYYVEGFNC